MKIGAVIVAAGRGIRAGGGLPKQYRELAGRPVLARTIDAFLSHPRIDHVIVVIGSDDKNRFDKLAQIYETSPQTCIGGASRTASVMAGLEALGPHDPDAVMIHDAARPLLSASMIDALADALNKHDAVLPALPSTDALMQLDADGLLHKSVDKAQIFAAQTPQAFRFSVIKNAYAQLYASTRASGGAIEGVLPGRLGGQSGHGVSTAPDLADDAAVAMRASVKIHTIPGEPQNFKITTPDDYTRAEAMLKSDTAALITVTGQGFDVHRLEPAETMWLCGVEIRDGLGLVGHSDADVGLHALTDAILGAASAGDIGQHFPPSDPQWAGVSSDRFVSHALKLLDEAGGKIRHADITLICERPKITPHRDAMRDRIAHLLGLDPGRVSIKATTTEGLGLTGRGEGIAAQAVVTASLQDMKA
jgi:2-C-methyl-D-erythritol 4-phosphate cytidylyltransferase/2-C-methyl-D-erythritol 2,4-cyclodiphosphate synthase